MAVVYTHDFDIQVGSQILSGEVEFNTDGEATVKYDSPLQGITISQQLDLTNFYKILTSMYHKFGSITKVEITEKTP